MNTTFSVKLPGAIGAQLKAMSAELRQPVTDIIASLLIFSAEHHRVALPIDGVEIVAKSDGVRIVIDGCAFQPMTPAQAIDFANTVAAVVELPRHILNLDLPDLIDVKRVGGGIAVIVTRDRVEECRRTFSLGMARIFAHNLRIVASHAAING